VGDNKRLICYEKELSYVIPKIFCHLCKKRIYPGEGLYSVSLYWSKGEHVCEECYNKFSVYHGGDRYKLEEKVKGQIERANKIYKTIKEFAELFPDEFNKCSIKSCGHCNNTGLYNKQPNIMCDNCGGMGFVGFKKLNGRYVCRSCNGYGCNMCEYNGTVDWVEHAKGSDIMERR
jgi:hypothetical protein